MAIILGLGALWFFGWKALYLFAIAALILVVARARGS